MGFFDRVKSFLGFDDEDDKKKKQSKPQQQNRGNSSRNQNNNAPRPGQMFLPTQQNNNQNRPKDAPKKPDNTISLLERPELPEVLKKATQKPKPKPQPKKDDGIMSNAEIIGRSAGRVGTNVVGGLIGMAKGAVELPASIAETPKLVKMGAAWATKNDKAMENAAAEENKGTRFAEAYRKKVAPVTDPLTKAELATDRKADEIADWGTDLDKNLTKGVTNLIPIDGAVKLTKIARANSAAKGANAATDAANVASDLAPNKAPGIKSVNPNREIDALKQGQADAAALPPAAPEMDPLQIAAQQAAADGKAMDAASRRATMLSESPASSLRKMPANGIQEPVPGQIPIRQLSQADPYVAAPVVPDGNTPAFMRRGQPDPQDAIDEAYLARERQAQIDSPDLDRPAFLDRMQPEQIIDNLRNTATDFTRDPDFAEIVQEAYLKTGHTNPLSIAADALSMTRDKGRVRAIVERLVPGADANALNRAVNSITGADDQTDILEALETAATRVTTGKPVAADLPFGPVSDAPVLPPRGFDPAPVQTRPDGAQIMSDDTVRAADGRDLGRVNQPDPEPEIPVVDETPAIPAFDEAAPLKKVKKAPAKAETTSATSSAPAKAADTTDTTAAPAKVKKEKPLPKTPQNELAPVKNTGAAKTGELGKSQGKYSRGQLYERTSMDATRQRGADGAATTDLDNFIDKIEDAGGMNTADRDVAVKLQERFKVGSPEHRMLGDLTNKVHTDAAQVMATIERVIRRTATADKLTDRFVSRLYKSTDESIEFTDKDFDKVIKKNEEFVKARDEVNASIEKFNGDPSDANAQAVMDAFRKVDEADRAAKFTEYKTAAKLTKGSKNPSTQKYVSKLEKDAGVYTMDWVDSSMLSSTRVMLNNFINTLGTRTEEAMFGKFGAMLARKLTKGATIGGGSRKGAKLGAKMGGRHWRSDMKLRKGAEGNRLVKAVKNFTTAGNTAGDRNTYAAAYSGAFDHYRAKLKTQGFKGDELDRRATVAALADDDNIVADYMNQALANNAMSSMTNGPAGGKIETDLVEKLARKAGGSQLAHNGAKLLVRMTLGFPTVITRSAIAGSKRAGVGFPSAGQAVWNAFVRKGPSEVTARHIKNSVKEFGSGATMYGVGFGLGSTGIITGAYPTTKAEQDRWKREGISENSIKIGNDYYGLPAALGVFALPFMIGANAANNQRDGQGITENLPRETLQTLINALPVDNVTNALEILNDIERGKDVGSDLARMGASATRAITPWGSLINQVAKMFDPTANDTTKGEAMEQFLSKLRDGIPGLANDLPDKTVDGKPVKNPDPVSRIFGAISTEQTDGVKKTQEIKAEGSKQTSTLKDAGVFKDKVRNILDDDTKLIFDKASKGEEVTPEEMKKLQGGITKNVTATEDTRFLEDGDYDTNLAVLKAKKAIMEADPTTQKGDLEDYDKQIARGEVYKELQTPYKNIKKYKEIALEEWRSLGDPESDDYDPDLYETLFDLDAALTDAGVSGRSSDSAKPKYYSKASKSGSGGGGGGRGKSDADRAADAELRRIQSNTISNTPDLKKLDLSDLAPKKLQQAKMPKLQQIKSSSLIKKRKISVKKA